MKWHIQLEETAICKKMPWLKSLAAAVMAVVALVAVVALMALVAVVAVVAVMALVAVSTTWRAAASGGNAILQALHFESPCGHFRSSSCKLGKLGNTRKAIGRKRARQVPDLRFGTRQ
jgi:hypothetical protein